MLIDWFTVAAQVVNFLVLVWLLKRFLYKPILKAIDAREQRIALALADADAKSAEAQQLREDLQHKNAAFDQQRAALLSRATDEAHAERQRLLDEARRDADGLRAERQDAFKQEQQSLNAEIARRTRKEVLAIARKALTELAGMSLEARMTEVFVRHLRALNDDTKKQLITALQASSDPPLIRSAFELPAEQRSVIQTALADTLPLEIQLRFETTPDLISGIELSANGRKFAWSISDYLELLEQRVDDWLTQASEHQSGPGPTPGTTSAPGKEAE